MAERIGASSEAGAREAAGLLTSLPRAEIPGERSIARVLRAGTFASGGIFLVSLPLELLPLTQATGAAIDVLRKAAASLLLITPVARLLVSGVVLGLRGEWRYVACAAAVMGLLGLAVGARLAG